MKGMSKYRALMVGASMLLTGYGFAASTIYVGGPGAADTNAGDDASTPVATIAQGISLVDAGGTVVVAAGTYQEAFTISKSVALQGSNYNVDPNTGSRVAESIILATAHNIPYGAFDAQIDVQAADVQISGFLFEGYNPAVATGSEPVGPDGVNKVGQHSAIFKSSGNNTVVTNNIFQNFSQIAMYDYAETTGNAFSNNRATNIGVPNALGYGTMYQAYQAFAAVENNYARHVRSFTQWQGQRIAGSPALIANNVGEDLSTLGVILNGISGTAPVIEVLNNDFSGASSNSGTAGIYAVSCSDKTSNPIVKREFTIAGNSISNFPAGYQFSNNNMTEPLRISGGTVTNVKYGAAFVNGLGYQGYIEFPSHDIKDATGGPAKFDPANAYAGGPIEAEVKDSPSTNSTGCSAYDAGYFAGKIALINMDSCNATDSTVAVKNAQDAGAIGVIMVETRETSGKVGGTVYNPQLPTRLIGDSQAASLTIPSTMVAERVGHWMRDKLASETVTARINGFYVPNNSFGVDDPSIITRETNASLVNVRIDNASEAGFVSFDIPVEIDFDFPVPTSIEADGIKTINIADTGTINGYVVGGSSIENSKRGVVIYGPDSNIFTQSARFAGNEIGAEIINGNLNASGTSFDGNTVAGITVEGDDATAEITNSDFINQSLDVQLADNPASFSVTSSNFDKDGTAIANLDPGMGDVLATGNWWGDASGPMSIDGTPYTGSGAKVTDGVNAADFLNEAQLVADSDGDGLNDDEEGTYGTDINNADTDGDGIEDGIEVATGTDPLDANDPADSTDADGDGLIASLDPDDGNVDTDGDGIKDGYEVKRGTSPTNAYDFPPFGDANADAQVDNVDAVAILEAFLNLRDFSEIRRPEIDINQDGRIDNVDAIILFNYYIANILYIPFP